MLHTYFAVQFLSPATNWPSFGNNDRLWNLHGYSSRFNFHCRTTTKYRSTHDGMPSCCHGKWHSQCLTKLSTYVLCWSMHTDKKLCTGTYDSFQAPWLQQHNFQVNVSFWDTAASGYTKELQDTLLSSHCPITDNAEIPVMPYNVSFAIICYACWLKSSTLQLNARSQNSYFNTTESLILTHNLFTIKLLRLL
jgi:hypothetical protein